MEKLEEYILQFRMDGNCEIDLIGDINLDHYTNTPKVRQYNQWLRRLGLSNIIHEATHIKNVGMGFSKIDHFIITDPEIYGKSDSIPTNASDHFFIYGTRKKGKDSSSNH